MRIRRGTDEKIGVRTRGGIETGSDQVFIEPQGGDGTVEPGHFQDGVDGVDDLGTAAVS